MPDINQALFTAETIYLEDPQRRCFFEISEANGARNSDKKRDKKQDRDKKQETGHALFNLPDEIEGRRNVQTSKFGGEIWRQCLRSQRPQAPAAP